jgi:hypothetical protein
LPPLRPGKYPLVVVNQGKSQTLTLLVTQFQVSLVGSGKLAAGDGVLRNRILPGSVFVRCSSANYHLRACEHLFRSFEDDFHLRRSPMPETGWPPDQTTQDTTGRTPSIRGSWYVEPAADLVDLLEFLAPWTALRLGIEIRLLSYEGVGATCWMGKCHTTFPLPVSGDDGTGDHREPLPSDSAGRTPSTYLTSTTRYLKSCQLADSVLGALPAPYNAGLEVHLSSRGEVRRLSAPLFTNDQASAAHGVVTGTSEIDFPLGQASLTEPRIRLVLNVVDSVDRGPARAQLVLRVNDSVTLRHDRPVIGDLPQGQAHGVYLSFSYLLTAPQSLALARATTVSGLVGPYPFELALWAVAAAGANYRASLCGIASQ